MTARIHRILAATSVAIAGLGGLIGITDPAGLGVSAETWNIVGNWMSLLGGVVGVGVTVVRQLQEPA